MTNPQVELRVYPEFSEVRTLVETSRSTLELSFSQGVWSFMVPDSLGLLSLPYSSVTHAETPSWLADLEGQRVNVRLDPLAPLQGAVLMRASDLLVQDEHGYYRVREDQLVFREPPGERNQDQARSVTFRLKAAGEGLLTYLTRGLHWQPRYTLDAVQEGTEATLNALADITNDTEGLHVPEMLELISGDVEMKLREDEDRPRMLYAMAAEAAPKREREGAELEELGELGGLYRYNVLNPPPLDARSTVSVAFLPEVTVQLQREARLETVFLHVGAQRGNFDRGYTMTVTENLPGGRMTLREDGRIAGQHVLSETPAGQPVQFILGRDPDVSYIRSLRQIGVERNPEGKGKVRRVSYEVIFTVKNSKNRPVEAVIRERHDDRVVMIKGADRDMDNIAALTVKVEAEASVEVSYTVTVDR